MKYFIQQIIYILNDMCMRKLKFHDRGCCLMPSWSLGSHLSMLWNLTNAISTACISWKCSWLGIGSAEITLKKFSCIVLSHPMNIVKENYTIETKNKILFSYKNTLLFFLAYCSVWTVPKEKPIHPDLKTFFLTF